MHLRRKAAKCAFRLVGIFQSLGFLASRGGFSDLLPMSVRSNQTPSKASNEQDDDPLEQTARKPNVSSSSSALSAAENTPMSFKRKQSAAGSSSNAPGRGLSGLFRRPSGGPPRELPPHRTPNFPPSSLTPLGASNAPGKRKASGANRGRSPSKTYRPPSPSGTIGRRIQDWQSQAGASAEEPLDQDEDPEDAKEQQAEVIVPRMLPELKRPDDQTPLPKIAMTVLCIIMIGEFLSANLAGPFMFFMLEDVAPELEEADVGFWAGIVGQ